MSDIDRKARAEAPTVLAHRCHCGAYAGFGFMNPRTKKNIDWWCWEHYPYKGNHVRQEVVEIAERLAS